MSFRDNSFLSITAFLGNTLILVALHKESSRHATSKLLFRTLATTDLCVGIILEPLAGCQMLKERWNICRFAHDATFTTRNILCLVSLFTLTTISVDGLLALLLGLRNRQFVTLKRTYVTETDSFVLPIVGSGMYFLNHHVTLWYRSAIVPSHLSFFLCKNFLCFSSSTSSNSK